MANKKSNKNITTIPLKHSQKQDLYLNYINALVKAENLQNRLEKMCSAMITTPINFNAKKTKGLNNYLNNLLVKVMVMQNIINYISGRD